MFRRRNKESDQIIAKMERQLDLIHTALVVRDPGTSVSAEAYEGLRKQVIAGATARQAHVAQLAEFDVAIRRGASLSDLQALVRQWLDQAGITLLEVPEPRDAFDSAVPDGTDAEVEIPAYINTVTNQLVRQGRLRERSNGERPALEVEDSAAGESTQPVHLEQADRAESTDTESN